MNTKLLSRCRLCGMEKDLSEFYFGHGGTCKSCIKTIRNEKYAKNIEESRMLSREYTKKAYIKNPGKKIFAVTRWKKANPEKFKAHCLIGHHPLAILRECLCDNPKKHNHHPDYSKPLEVIKLCPACHVAEHKRLRSLSAQAAMIATSETSVTQLGRSQSITASGFPLSSDHQEVSIPAGRD